MSKMSADELNAFHTPLTLSALVVLNAVFMLFIAPVSVGHSH